MSLRVLAVVDYYLPGYKGGGPTVSVSRLIERLSGEIEFAVFTRDRDLGDERPYAGVVSDEWSDLNGVNVYYASPASAGASGLARAIHGFRPDVLYLNSYFSGLTRAALALRKRGRTGEASIVIAPRGEFSPGALKLKAWKKTAYLRLSNMTRLHDGVLWQASSEHEQNDIRAVIGGTPQTFIKPPDMFTAGPCPYKPEKRSGEARFAFISRISPKKNLLHAIKLLGGIGGDATLTIYGPIEDEAYWSACQGEIARLPKNIKVHAAGPVPPPLVRERLAREHFFLFPTLGENFGHVIPEALAAGCPALLSDQTPWLDLQEHDAGWAIPLGDIDSWRVHLSECVQMDGGQYAQRSLAAHAYVSRISQSNMDLELGQQLFERAAKPLSRLAA